MSDQPCSQVHRWEELTIDRPMALLQRRRIIGDQAMISEILLDKGCVVPSHSHCNEQFAVVTSGHLRFGVGVEGTDAHREIDVREGEVLHLLSNQPHSVVAIEDSRVLDVFSPVSETTGVDRT